MADNTQPEADAALKPVIFEVPVEVTQSDIDGLGHVNNVVYLRWVQEAATAHWFHSATAMQQAEIAWVAIRHELDYLKPAYLGETIIARTYVGEVIGVKFERFVEIYRPADNQVLARSRSVWVAIDAATKKPRRVSPEINRQFKS